MNTRERPAFSVVSGGGSLSQSKCRRQRTTPVWRVALRRVLRRISRVPNGLEGARGGSTPEKADKVGDAEFRMPEKGVHKPRAEDSLVIRHHKDLPGDRMPQHDMAAALPAHDISGTFKSADKLACGHARKLRQPGLPLPFPRRLCAGSPRGYPRGSRRCEGLLWGSARRHSGARKGS